MAKTYKMYVDCANCGQKMEDCLNTIEGIKEAKVNYMLQKLTVTFEEGADENKVLKTALKTCRKKVDDDIEIEF